MVRTNSSPLHSVCASPGRRLPPRNVQKNISALVELCPDLTDDILSSVDQPLQLLHDTKAGRPYLICDYNRDGESYRSPWTNTYDPPLSEGTTPSPALRKLEEAANEAFDVYREMYYDGGVSSVYLWDLDDENFAGVVLLQKVHSPTTTSQQPSASWDSIHVFETSKRGRSAHYRLTSTVMLYMASTSGNATLGNLELSGSLTRQNEQDATVDSNQPTQHIANIGKFIEDQELKIRGALQDVYLQKTRNIVNELRSIGGMEEGKKRQGMQAELVGLLKRGS